MGEVTEWPKVHDWKSCVPARVPRVRIPPSPQRIQRVTQGVGQFRGRNELPRDESARARLRLTDVVETALARALTLAAENKRWDIVEKIAAELHARRTDRVNVNTTAWSQIARRR